MILVSSGSKGGAVRRAAAGAAVGGAGGAAAVAEAAAPVVVGCGGGGADGDAMPAQSRVIVNSMCSRTMCAAALTQSTIGSTSSAAIGSVGLRIHSTSGGTASAHAAAFLSSSAACSSLAFGALSMVLYASSVPRISLEPLACTLSSPSRASIPLCTLQSFNGSDTSCSGVHAARPFSTLQNSSDEDASERSLIALAMRFRIGGGARRPQQRARGGGDDLRSAPLARAARRAPLFLGAHISTAMLGAP